MKWRQYYKSHFGPLPKVTDCSEEIISTQTLCANGFVKIKLSKNFSSETNMLNLFRILGLYYEVKDPGVSPIYNYGGRLTLKSTIKDESKLHLLSFMYF